MRKKSQFVTMENQRTLGYAIFLTGHGTYLIISRTIGSFVEELLTSNKFVDTVLPRFPAVVSKEVNENLTEWQTQNPGVLRKPTYIAVDEKGTKRVRGSSTRRANNSRDRDRDRDRERGHKRSRSRSQERGSRDDRSRESKRVRSKSPEQTAPQKKTPRYILDSSPVAPVTNTNNIFIVLSTRPG